MIRAVERALAIFDAFDAQHQSLSLQEIGERIGMPKATTFRLVNTLQSKGFLVRLDDQRYCLAPKMLRLAGLVKSTLGIREAARPTMAELCRATGETVTLNIRSGMERICIDVMDTPSPLMTIVRPGEHVSLLRGATARLLLAYAREAEIKDIIARTAKSEGVDVTELRASLAEIRRRGYACTSGQRITGVTAIAVPIFDISDEVHYSLAITGPSVRMDARLEEFKKILIDAGASVSALMGASPTSHANQDARELRRKKTSDATASDRRRGARRGQKASAPAARASR